MSYGTRHGLSGCLILRHLKWICILLLLSIVFCKYLYLLVMMLWVFQILADFCQVVVVALKSSLPLTKGLSSSISISFCFLYHTALLWVHTHLRFLYLFDGLAFYYLMSLFVSGIYYFLLWNTLYLILMQPLLLTFD